MTGITESRVARELIAANRDRKRAHVDKYNAIVRKQKEIEAAKAMARGRKGKAAPAATVDEFIAAGGQIERLPQGASGIKPRDGGLRFDHSGGRALIKREFRFYP